MSAKEKRTYSNIFNVTIRCTMDEYDENGGLRIFNDDFELSQVIFIRVALGDGEYKELDISHVVELSPGDYDIEIGLGYFYNAYHMFQDVNLLFCDMSDVDLSILTIATGMFCNTFIEKTPFEKLPATTLAENCYSYMFYGCTLLATAPELPATNLADYCYQDMFKGCTSLTAAPVLPATTLAENCYLHMFDGCTNLNYIKMLATDISATDCLYEWVRDVASAGTFVKSKDATWRELGYSGVPSGWTVITDDQLVNGKVVNPISVRYGNYSSFIKYYPVYVDSVYPVSSDLYVGFDVNDVDGELVYVTRQISIGETSQAPTYTKTTPVTNIVYGPKEDACFIYDFPEANEDVTLSIFDILLGETEYGGFYERGMTWREYCGSRYNVRGFRISGDYVYNNASLVEDANGNLVSPDDLIVENGNYYTVE